MPGQDQHGECALLAAECPSQASSLLLQGRCQRRSPHRYLCSAPLRAFWPWQARLGCASRLGSKQIWQQGCPSLSLRQRLRHHTGRCYPHRTEATQRGRLLCRRPRSGHPPRAQCRVSCHRQSLCATAPRALRCMQQTAARSTLSRCGLCRGGRRRSLLSSMTPLSCQPCTR